MGIKIERPNVDPGKTLRSYELHPGDTFIDKGGAIVIISSINGSFYATRIGPTGDEATTQPPEYWTNNYKRCNIKIVVTEVL